MKYTFDDGGVTAAKGFKAAGMHCGIRKNRDKKDLMLLVSQCKATAAAVYTQNLVLGAPCVVTRQHLEKGSARAVICNSGIANTCAADGIEKANEMCNLTAAALDMQSDDILVASTGVIGPSIKIEPIKGAIPVLAVALSENGATDAAQAIMTTDTHAKQCAVKFMLGGKMCTLGGMAKGSGMIAPNMATMLAFVTTDCSINSVMLNQAIKAVTQSTFNMLTIDGDTSTNDMFIVMANGMAGNTQITQANADYAVFVEALEAICTNLCRQLSADGEGATKLLECRVSGAATVNDARIASKSVVNSALVKSAMFGADANWGRVLCAIGYSGAKLNVKGVKVAFHSASGEVTVCEKGAGIEFCEKTAKKVLSENEITIQVTLDDGNANATAWGCDLTYDYVRINGDYRT